MPITDIYSKRQKKLRGETPDVYQYDNLPEQLRVQIIYIMRNVIGSQEEYSKVDLYNTVLDIPNKVKKAYDHITDTLCHEFGKLHLPANYDGTRDKMKDLEYFFLQVQDIEEAFSVIELSFRFIDTDTRYWEYPGKNCSDAADEAIQELNERFREHGVGYYYVNGKIIRVDDEFVHSEVVKPALGILNRKEYAGAQQEFQQAHEHYRAGRTKEALNECLKSLESMMKSICDKRGWNYDQGDSANRLIGICFDNGIIPQFWKSHFDTLRSLLAGSVPPARNKLSGHGQGAAPKPVPRHIAGYVLHMTAATIVFLAEAEADGTGA